LLERVAETGITNLIVLPYQPFDRFAEVLASADVLVVLLAPTASPYSVPSKTLSYLCASRPVLAMMPADNLAAEIIARRANAGYVVVPDDRAGFLVAAFSLRFDPGLRATLGSNGRQYAEGNFELDTVCSRFLGAIELTGADRLGRLGRLWDSTIQASVRSRMGADSVGNLARNNSVVIGKTYDKRKGSR
jgi:glycosyltransferase involved in cell wall biosynthesis